MYHIDRTLLRSYHGPDKFYYNSDKSIRKRSVSDWPEVFEFVHILISNQLDGLFECLFSGLSVKPIGILRLFWRQNMTRVRGLLNPARRLMHRYLLHYILYDATCKVTPTN